MAVTGAIAVERDSGEDRRIYLRFLGKDKIFWYVIEEKSTQSSANELPACVSVKDRVRRLPLPDANMFMNNLAVINLRVYLIGGDLHTHTQNPDGDDSLGYYYLNLDSDLGVVKEWSIGGGKSSDKQTGGGVTVAQDGRAYSVGPTLYQLSPADGKWVKLQTPPQGPNPMPNGFLYWSRLLGITKNKLYVYRIGGGVDDANVMLSFDLESRKWDDDVLDDDFWGDWSSGVVLYDDRYLFSFGSRSPKRRPIPEEPARMTRRVQVVEVPEEEVAGIYVFDLKRRQWLPEPVQGLLSVIPQPYQPSPGVVDYLSFSPQLFQIRKDNDHHLALLWDSYGTSRTTLTWCKFILDNAATEECPAFSARSLSPGFCPLDVQTFYMLNCAVGM